MEEKIHYLDGRQALVERLKALTKDVEDGKIVAVAWVGLKATGDYRSGWDAIDSPATKLKTGSYVGGSLLLAGMQRFLYEMSTSAD